MKYLNELPEIFQNQLREIYCTEKIQIDTFPGLMSKINNPELKKIVFAFIEETRFQLYRLEEVFSLYNELPKSKETFFSSGILDILTDEATLLRKNNTNYPDILLAMHNINHFEIARYNTLISFSKANEIEELAQLFTENLEANKKLENLLTGYILQNVFIDTYFSETAYC